MSQDQKIIKKTGNDAHAYETTYHGCAQCVLKALQENLDLGDDLTFKAASALAGGMARMGEACGSLLGGVLAISLAFGRDRLEVTSESPAYMRAHKLAGELAERFREELGGIRCWDVQTTLFGRSFDLNNPSEAQAFVEAGGYEKCPEVARKAAELAAEIILREKEAGLE
jgi:C_GCAxxG_C_C family probable redox protein